MTERLITFMFKHYGGWSEVYIAMTGADLEDITFVGLKDLEDDEEDEFEGRYPDNKLARFFIAHIWVVRMRLLVLQSGWARRGLRRLG